MSFIWPGQPPARALYGYERAIVDEVSMLLDYVAGCPTQTLHNLAVTPDQGRIDLGKPTATMPVPTVLSELATIKGHLDNKPDATITSSELSFLFLVRDALNTLVKPASGLTVAYTAMVVGNRRGEAVKSRAVLAEQAYAGLRRTARWHRLGHRLLLVSALLLTATAVWDSARVALGKSLLHNLSDLRAKQADIFREAVKLEEAFAQPNAPVLPLIHHAGKSGEAGGPVRLTVRLCDRPKLLLSASAEAPLPSQPLRDAAADNAVFESAAQQDICDRDKLLANSFYLAHGAIDAYAADWPAVAGGGFNVLATVVRLASSGGQQLCAWVGMSCASHPDPIAALIRNEKDGDGKRADSELLIAPVLVVLGNYVLPVVFAMLGAAAFVILDFYSKLRDSLLGPRDHVLSWIRLVLGSVIGACIGLFFSSYGPHAPGPQADLIGALTLTASGVAFLAGFGVEGVFAMLGTLVQRVFGGRAP